MANGSAELPQTASLLSRLRQGDSRALSQLLLVQGERLRIWARGRIPSWARAFQDTADLVQDALLKTIQRVDQFENRGKGALQAYLRAMVINAIHDEERRSVRHPTDALDAKEFRLASRDLSPFDVAEQEEHERRYKAALQQLRESERMLVVGRLELDLNYEQLALMSGRAKPGAARVATRRAVEKLAQLMTGD